MLPVAGKQQAKQTQPQMQTNQADTGHDKSTLFGERARRER